MNLRTTIVRILQTLGLNRTAHRLYYGYVHGFDTANKSVLPALESAFEKALDTPLAGEGEYFEFGVFKGYAFLHAQRTADRLGLHDMRFFGFDSFEGLPPVEGPDQTERDDFYEGQYACSRSEVEENLTSEGVDWSRTHLIEGFFEESLRPEVRTRFEMGPVAVALIDCDLYSSTTKVMTFIEPLLEDQSILLFDDWNCFDGSDERGQRRAFREFLASNGRWQPEPLFSYGTYGQVFQLRKSGDSPPDTRE